MRELSQNEFRNIYRVNSFLALAGQPAKLPLLSSVFNKDVEDEVGNDIIIAHNDQIVVYGDQCGPAMFRDYYWPPTHVNRYEEAKSVLQTIEVMSPVVGLSTILWDLGFRP